MSMVRTPAEIGESLKAIVEDMNSMSIKELDAFIQSINRDEAIGPLLDPMAWRDTGRFAAAAGTKRALQAIRAFKIEVSGIGNFDSVA